MKRFVIKICGQRFGVGDETAVKYLRERYPQYTISEEPDTKGFELCITGDFLRMSEEQNGPCVSEGWQPEIVSNETMFGKKEGE